MLKGASSLSNHELISILLRTGTKEESVLQLANRILRYFDGLELLQNATLDEMVRMKGLDKQKQFTLLLRLNSESEWLR